MKQPGDPVGSAMEYMPGNGVYEENGELFAGVCGELKEDGVVFARCNVTHDILKHVDGELWSEELRRRVTRKTSSMYGKVQV